MEKEEINQNVKNLVGERMIINSVNKESKIEFEMPPSRLTPQNIIYWSEHYKKLNNDHPIQIKAQKFLELNLIKYDKETKQYYVEPIAGYNETTYHLKWNKELKDFECTCQGFQTKLRNQTKPYCSHQLAVWMSIKMTNWNKSRDAAEIKKAMEDLHEQRKD